MKPKIEKYLTVFFGEDPRSFFMEWDLNTIRADVDKWNVRSGTVYVYIIANERPRQTLHAQVGSGNNIFSDKRIKNTRRKKTLTGRTKKNSNTWRLLMWVELPPYRNYSTQHVKQVCRMGRGWFSRCTRAIEFARDKGLRWGVSDIMLEKNSPYYMESLSN